MNTKLEHIINELKGLTLLETSELVNLLETTFGISASEFNTVALKNSNANDLPANEIQEEKTSFDVSLIEIPADKKIAVLKIIRNITGLGLKESKDIVDNIPKLIKEKVSKEESETIKAELEIVGAKVLIK
jgi:large subunit ribosomal protein L7/L12